MLRSLLLINVLIALFTTVCLSQKDSLSFEYGPYGSSKYKVNDKDVPSKIFYGYLAKNDPALQSFDSGKKLTSFGNVMSYIGGFLIGYNIGTVMINKKKDYTVGAIGLGVLAVSFPITNHGMNKTQKAIQTFNTDELPVYNNITPQNYVSDAQKNWLSACVVVRIPVYKAKVKYLQEQINKSKSNNGKEAIQKELDNTLAQNKTHFELLYSGFEKFFDAKKVYFIPDTLFKDFMAGKQTGFLTKEGTLDTKLQCVSDQKYYFIAGKDNDQLLLVDESLSKPSRPFPHKKNTLFPAFKKIFDKKNFVNNQIIWFNKKLNDL